MKIKLFKVEILNHVNRRLLVEAEIEVPVSNPFDADACGFEAFLTARRKFPDVASEVFRCTEVTNV